MRLRHPLPLLLLALLASVARGQEVLGIVGTLDVKLTRADIPKPIRLGCECALPENARYIVDWEIPPAVKTIELDDKGLKLHAWAPVGRYPLRCTVIIAELDDQGRLMDLVKQKFDGELVVRVGDDPSPDPGPSPGPSPGPGPSPNPNVPDGWNGLTKLSYELGTKTGNHRTLAAKLAENYSAVAEGLGSGKYLSIGAANDDLTARNRQVLSGASLEAWRDAFFAPHAKRMQELSRQGAVNDTASVAKAYSATADGLKLVK